MSKAYYMGKDQYLTKAQRFIADNGYKHLSKKRLLQFWTRVFRQMGVGK